MSSYVNIEDFRDVRISDFLATLGHYPVKKSGKELFYHSMLRETKQSTPSLSVWDEGGKWIDRGGANHTGIYGGGIIQLALAYWPELSFKEVLIEMRNVLNIYSSQSQNQVPVINLNAQKPQEYAFKLVKTKPLGTNFLITKYLESRGILDVAEGHLQEVYYKNHLNKDSLTNYYAIGWINEHNNYEFSTIKGFKSSIGAKGISIIQGSDKDHVAIFEGYMDYLSWLKHNNNHLSSPTVYVLNSIVQLNKTLDRIKNFKLIDLYLDNDLAGKQATIHALNIIPHANDRSPDYKGYKDFNEMLVDNLGCKFQSLKKDTKR
ncbi:toprim domain-containing protein [Sphingobacterium bovistauri]|uniref:Toprim domain-containing protein n=1 Tax=Sphingobacterium bovistauri TaxID=2781959 RepID=A0ABS7Z249_9SPHI|nr:toprim domain-containing protein [Sphingobacterium bovistauri]MCA5004053.1 toprim domain-containing protein [Sphingobacterium bovistauri]